MPEAKNLMSNHALRTKIEANLGRPVLGLLELPMDPTEQKIVAALGLKEGDIMNKLEIGGVHNHTWCCCVSLPPDCDADIDG